MAIQSSDSNVRRGSAVHPRPTNSESLSEHAPGLRVDSAHPLTWTADVGHQSAAPIGHVHQAQAASLDQLVQQQELARQFLMEAAHEIRAPIATACQLISAVSINARQAHANGDPSSISPRQTNMALAELDLLDLAHNRLVQANSWVEGILLDNRLAESDNNLIRNRFYPQQWQASMEALLQNYAAFKGVRIQWSGWDRSLPKLYLDPNHLSRIVLNLVTNAVNASSAGQSIDIRVAYTPSLNPHLQLAIVDQAGGLSQQILDEVNRRTLSEFPNSSRGLGLYIAKRLTRSLGGELSAATHEEQGTEFRVSLPIDDLQILLARWLSESERQGRGDLVDSDFQIHLVRGKDLPDFKLFDRQLQLLSKQQFVYRLTRQRWLCITKHSPAIPHPDNWLGDFCQRQKRKYGPAKIFHSIATILSLGPTSNGLGDNSQQIARDLAAKAKDLIGDLVPQVDPTVTKSPELRPFVESQLKLTRSAERAEQQESAAATKTRRPKRRVKLKIPPARTKAAERDAKMYRALRELAQEWRKTQYRMQHVHPAHKATRPRPATSRNASLGGGSSQDIR